MKKGYIELAVMVGLVGVLGILDRNTGSNNPSCGVKITAGRSANINAKGNSEMSNATAVTKADFDKEVLQATEPVLVDFWAPWCMPCKMLAPVLDEVAAEFVGKAKVVKVNTDEEPELSAKYGIKGIPTLMFFKGGESVDRVVGVQPKQDLVKKLNDVIGK